MLESVRSWRCSECHNSFNGNALKERECPKCEAVLKSGEVVSKYKIRCAAEYMIKHADWLVDSSRHEIFQISLKVTQDDVTVMYTSEGKLGGEELLTFGIESDILPN